MRNEWTDLLDDALGWGAGLITGYVTGWFMKRLVQHFQFWESKPWDDYGKIPDYLKPKNPPNELVDIDTLIDIALDRKDRQWFMELSERRNKILRRY
jgi:hypothetical protein